MLFLGVAGDLELYTTEEVITLRNAGIFKSSSGASQSLSKLPSLTSLGQIQSAPTTPKATPHSPKVKPDSSSKRQDYTSSSKSHKHPVSVAAGSSTSLEKSNEWDHDAECRHHERSRECKDCVPIWKARAHTTSIPQGMTMVGHLSMADLLNLVVLWGIPIQRNDDFTVKVDHVNHERWHLSLTRTCMPSATSDLSFYSYKLMSYVCQFKYWSPVIWHESGVSPSCRLWEPVI